MNTRKSVRFSIAGRIFGQSSALALSAALALTAAACSRDAQEPLTPAAGHGAQRAPQQQIVNASAAALNHMRENPRFAELDAALARAKGVLIFPHVRKASLLFGGGGGSGVLVVRAADGSWSDPAFYSIGAPSVGVQVGYQEATLVLVIKDDATLEKIMRSNFTLGTNTGAGIGHPSERGTASGEVVSRPIELFAEAGGAFAGISLDGYVTAPREKHNVAYYGASVTPRQILIERSVHQAGAEPLRHALAPRAPKVE